MSIQLMSRCFDGDLPVEGARQVLLLKLCDLANDDGTCWPSIALLARSIRRGERQTRYLLAELVAIGVVLVSVGTGPRHTNRYRITLPPKPEQSSTRNTSRQSSAGGSAVQGAAQCMPPLHPAAGPPCTGLPHTPAPASAANPSENHQRTTTHPPGSTGGGGVQPEFDQSAARRRQQAEQRRHFERILDRLGVASGRRALPRWWIQACRNPLAETFEQRCALIVWAIEEARAQGRTVNYASDVVHLVDQWVPDEMRGDDTSAASA